MALKKVPRSQQIPQEHKKPEIEGELKKAAEDSIAGLGTGKDKAKNKQIIEAVSTIVQKWYECEQKTQDGRDKQLIQYIVDTFQDLLKPYVDNFSKTVELEDVIKEVLSDSEIQEKIHEKIFNALKSSIRKLKVKTSGSSTSKTSDNLENIFDQLKNSNNQNLQKYRKELSNVNKKHTSEIIDVYRKSCKTFYDKIVSSKQKEQKINTTQSVGNQDIQKIHEKQINILKKKFKPFQIVKKKKNYFSIITAIFKKFIGVLGKIFGPVFNVLKKIGGFIFGVVKFAVKWTILPVINGIIGISKLAFKGLKLLGKGFIGTLRLFKIDKMIKGVLNLFLDIGKLVKKAVKNTFLAIIMTPAGMYAMGFMIGYVWTKLVNMFKGGKSIPERLEHIKNFIGSMISPFIGGIKNFFYKIMNDYVNPLVTFFKPIVTATVDIAKSMLEWIFNNKEIVSVILTLCPVLESLISILGPARSVMKMAGHPLSALMAAGILAVYYGVQNIFAWKKDEDFRLAMGKGKLFSRFNDVNSVFIEGLSNQDRKNYDELSLKIGSERNDLEALIRDIDEIKTEYKDDKNTKTDLSKIYPEFVESVFNSQLFGDDKSALRRFKKFSKNKTVVEQLNELIKYVNQRYDKLITIQAGLSSSKSTTELQHMLSRVASFDNGKITISQNVNDVAKDIKHDDYDGTEKSWKNLWLADPESGHKKAQQNALKLAGKPLNDQSSITREKEIDNLLNSLDDKERAIVKNYLMSNQNSKDIEALKNSTETERNATFKKILTDWADRIKKNEEEQLKSEEEKIKEEINKLNEDTLMYQKLNKGLEQRIKDLTEGT